MHAKTYDNHAKYRHHEDKWKNAKRVIHDCDDGIAYLERRKEQAYKDRDAAWENMMEIEEGGEQKDGKQRQRKIEQN